MAKKGSKAVNWREIVKWVDGMQDEVSHIQANLNGVSNRIERFNDDCHVEPKKVMLKHVRELAQELMVLGDQLNNFDYDLMEEDMPSGYILHRKKCR